MGSCLLDIKNLKTRFYTEQGVVEAVNDISFSVEQQETVGLVGESGAGKSVTGLSILNMIPSPGKIEEGEVNFKGENLLLKKGKEMRNMRGEAISMIFQDPMTSLNPTMTVGQQLERVIRLHSSSSKNDGFSLIPRFLRRGNGKKDIHHKSIEILEKVSIPNPEQRTREYPHQFSGGMRQRILIAMALSCYPDLIIADEPTTALDVTIEAQIFDLINQLVADFQTALILITHDLGIVAHTCEKVNIMYAGEIVEKAPTETLFHDPMHPYTRGLLESVPSRTKAKETVKPIEGKVPDPLNLPSGCSFYPRCPESEEECAGSSPELVSIDPDREAACLNI